MAVLTGPVYVSNPTPQILRYGLFTVATGPLDMPTHGADGGVTWLGNSCGTAWGFEVNCQDPEDPPTKDLSGAALSNAEATPFVVGADFECSVVGLSRAERDRLVLEKLRATEQAAVENIFSQGTFGQSPSLASNATPATDVGPATDVVEAFSQLEENFYDTYGYPGVIHVPHEASAFVQAADIITMQNRIWRTAAGTAVSIGNYAGLSPSGASPAPGNTWLYITPPVAIWRTSDAFITPIEGALNRETNEVNMFAEREYVVAFDPCPTFATEVTLTEGS